MTGLSDAELEGALERFVRNQLAIQELTEEQEAIKGYFKTTAGLVAGTTMNVGKFYIKVTGHSRIDQKLAEKELTYRERKAVSKEIVDPTKARHVLDKDKLEKITKVYDNRIEIGLL